MEGRSVEITLLPMKLAVPMKVADVSFSKYSAPPWVSCQHKKRRMVPRKS